MSGADVEMKPVEEKSKVDDKSTGDKDITPPPQLLTPLEEIKINVALIEKGVSTLEPRFTNRVLRSLTSLRRKLDGKILRNAVEEVFVKGER